MSEEFEIYMRENEPDLMSACSRGGSVALGIKDRFLVCWQAARESQPSGFTAVDMGTAAADGRRSFAEHLIRKNLEDHPDQDTLLTAAYIGMWIASEVGGE